MKNILINKKILVLVLIVFITVFIIFQNNYLVVSNHIYKNETIPDDFNNFKIVHISDLHNKLFGNNQELLLYKIKKESPDIVLITGDLIDRRRYNLENAMKFINGVIDIASTYYVSGNHEALSNKYDVIKKSLIDAGVIILDNTFINIEKGSSKILLMGLADPQFSYDLKIMEELLEVWKNSYKIKILLSHRPELFELYSKNNMDIIFSGHAHGGQIRLPFIKGLIAPNQGLFPKYTSGSYKKGLSTMYVSRGLGNSVFPFRIFNNPEIVVVTLKSNI